MFGMACCSERKGLPMGAATRWWNGLRGDVPASARGLWFGITDLVVDGRVSRHIYVAGCPSFSTEDDTGEWATEYVWWPEGRYLSLEDAGIPASDDFPEVLAAVVALVKDLAPWDDVDVDGVAVGFDDGDFEVVWTSG